MNGRLAARVAGVALAGPGLADWVAAQPLLREPARWQYARTVIPLPHSLPATERRRAGVVVKASVAVAEAAVAAAGVPAAQLASVFASATSDASNCDALCRALAQSPRLVSPTRFTNSVHNAPAAYWHIACGARQPSTSLAAHDATVAAALLEALVQVNHGEEPVLLVVCDQDMGEPMRQLRPVCDDFAFALVLQPAAAGAASGPSLQAWVSAEEAAETPLQGPAAEGLEALRRSVPAARSLPLLQALARADVAPTPLALRLMPGGPMLHVQLQCA